MNNYFANIFNKIENLDISFKLFLLTLFSVIFIRNILESFSDPGFHGPFLGWTTIFLHMTVWFISVFIWLSILLKILTKNSIEKIIKVQLFFFPIILLPPIFDLIISGGVGKFLSYIFVSNIKDLGDYFLNFFFKSDISLGLRLETVVILFVSAIYIYFKTKRTALVIIGVLLIYTILFIFGSFPSFPSLFSKFNIDPLFFYQILVIKNQDILIGQNYLFPYQSFAEKFKNFFNLIASSQIFVSLIIGLLIWFFIWQKNKFFAFVKNVRPLRLLHYWLMFFIGLIIAYSLFGIIPSFNFYNLLALILALIVISCSWLTAIGENDIYDLESDSISNSWRPLVTGKFTISEWSKINFILFLLSIVGALIIGYQIFILVFFSHLIAFLYSSPPLRLKRIPILNSFLIAIASLIIILFGFFWLAPESKMTDFPLKYIILILLTGTLVFNFKDIKDIEGDKISGVKTLMVVFGEKKGKFIIGCLFFAASILIPVFLKEPTLLIMAFLFGILGFVLINKKNFRETPVILTSFLYIISIFIFYWLKS